MTKYNFRRYVGPRLLSGVLAALIAVGWPLIFPSATHEVQVEAQQRALEMAFLYEELYTRTGDTRYALQSQHHSEAVRQLATDLLGTTEGALPADLRTLQAAFARQYEIHLLAGQSAPSPQLVRQKASADVQEQYVRFRTAFYEHRTAAEQRRQGWLAAWIAAQLTLVGLIGYGHWRGQRYWQALTRQATAMSEGQALPKAVPTAHPLDRALHRLDDQQREVVAFVEKIGAGQFDVAPSAQQEATPLGRALVHMRDQLSELASEAETRHWQVSGAARFSDLLRQHRNADVSALGQVFISELVKYLQANQGGLFVLDGADEAACLELVAAYAYDKKRHAERRLDVGEGLLGQCVREGEPIYLEEIPDQYVFITSGLGEATPGCLLLVPIRLEEEVLGVVELAAFQPWQSYQINWVSQVCTGLAATLAARQQQARTEQLLAASRQSHAELVEKEQQMSQHADKLRHMQDTLNEKLSELELETNLSREIVAAINKTNASIEFDMDGRIISVNDMYLSVMGYTRDALVGRTEAELIPPGEANRQQFEMLWESLRNGSYHAGEYRRLNHEGKEVWLNGTYNPILNLAGKPYKVMQFAQFTTEEKERDLDMTSKINALSQSLPLLDLDTDGRLLKVNQAFMDLTGYRRTDLRQLQLDQVLTEASDAPAYAQLWHELRAGNAQSQSFGYHTKNGEVRFGLINFSPVRNLAGEVYKVLSVLVDLTEQKAMEVQLQAQKAELMTRIHMLDQAAFVFELDADGHLIAFNAALAQQLEYTCDQLEGQPFQRVVWAEKAPADLMAKLAAATAGGQVFRATIPYGIAQLASWADTTVALLPATAQRPARYLGIAFDVTQQVKRAADLQHSLAEEKMKNAILHLQEESNQVLPRLLTALAEASAQEAQQMLHNELLPTLRLSAEGVVEEANQLVALIYGLPEDQWQPCPVSHLFRFASASAETDFYQRIAAGKVITERLRCRAHERDFRVTAIPIFADRDKPHSMVMFLENAPGNPLLT